MARARASMREVADRAGVAMSSVSRVISNHPDVSPTMRERVLAAIDELGYQPDLLAQSMRSGATRSVGFVVGDISNPLLAEIALGAETALRSSGYSMLLTNSENDPALDASHIDLFEQRRVDALLLSLASETDEPTLERLERFEGPVVSIDRELPDRVGAGFVLSDHRAGMRAAGGHLLDLGHRRIDLIAGRPLRFTREREAGLREAYRERGLEETCTIAEGQLDASHGREATRALLDGDDPPTAIVAGGNQLLAGVLVELRERAIEVGRGLSVVSCDETPLTESFAPPIATIRRDTRALGQVAAEMLLGQLGGTRAMEQVVLPTEFVASASCMPLAPST
jgi:LacI family transcriptional regulator